MKPIFFPAQEVREIYIPLCGGETSCCESQKRTFKIRWFLLIPCRENRAFSCHKISFSNKHKTLSVNKQNKHTQSSQPCPTKRSTKSKNTSQEPWRTNLLFAAFQDRWIPSIATELPSYERTSSSRSRDPTGLASRFFRSARFRRESPRRRPPRSPEQSRRRWSWSSTWSQFIPHPNRPSRPPTKLRQPALTKTPVPAGCLPSRIPISPRPRPHPWLDDPSFPDWTLTPSPPDNHLPASWDLLEESRWKWELRSGDTRKSHQEHHDTTPIDAHAGNACLRQIHYTWFLRYKARDGTIESTDEGFAFADLGCCEEPSFMLYDLYIQFSLLDTTIYTLLTIILFLDFIARHRLNPSQTVGHRRAPRRIPSMHGIAHKNEEYIFRVKLHRWEKNLTSIVLARNFFPRFGARPLQQTHWWKMYRKNIHLKIPCQNQQYKMYYKSLAQLSHKRRSSRGPNVSANKCSVFHDCENATKRLRCKIQRSGIGASSVPLDGNCDHFFNRLVITHGRYSYDLS